MNLSNYRTNMISPILSELYGSILENKISIWLESHGKRAKDQANFRGYHSTVDHLIGLRIIVEDCLNNKTTLLCCFIEFRKKFVIVLRTNLWNRLEELKVPSELRVVAIRLYEKVIAKFRSTEGWREEINCHIGVKEGSPLSHALFGICIDKLEDSLEAAGCVGQTLASIIILLLYANDIVLMARNPCDLSRQLRILMDLCSITCMIVNSDKMKVMIIKSNKITYNTFVYDNNILEEVPSYKYFEIDIHHKLNWNYSIEKIINGG
jgi:hypothetical protein